ncbi:hypothetical protein DEX24_13900 [Kurthia sibirica]|uniref:ATP-grasp domain-containing protein n=1 Tax=Kurthia sibirica TaxID=202750 RepID=A0A2U3AIC9_9BACL|nr:hypothetical protein DEX24_13900 [Kurthia sibirica]
MNRLKKAYIIYDEVDARKNNIFIDQLIEAATQQQIELTLLLTNDFSVTELVRRCQDAVFVFYRARNCDYVTSLEQANIAVLNSSHVNALANNKYMTLQFARTLGIPTVPLFRDAQHYEFPLVLKTIDGHGGNEVLLCQNEEELYNGKKVFENRLTLIQPYIESNATDVRVWVLDDVILGAVKRTGSKDFRSNYTLGGTIEKYNLNNLQIDHVLAMQKAIKSDYIGMDFLLLEDGTWLLNEIEDPVGARAYYDLFENYLPVQLMDYFVSKFIR